MAQSAFSATVPVLVVVVIILAAGIGYFVIGTSTSTTNTSYGSLITSSSSSSSTSSSTTNTLSTTSSSQDSTSTSFSCSNNTFSGLSSIAGGNISSSSYNPVYLFGNFSSMSIMVSESANGTIAFADTSSYVVVGTPTINNTKFVEVNFTVSVSMGSFGVTNESSTAWFAPDGNASEFMQGPITYSGDIAAQEGNSLALSFTNLVSLGDVLASNLPSGSIAALNQTTLNFGQSQIKVTNYAVSQSFIQYVETYCPSVNVSSLDLAWQSGVVGGTSIITYFNFNTATSATSSFGITEQLVSFTKAG